MNIMMLSSVARSLHICFIFLLIYMMVGLLHGKKCPSVVTCPLAEARRCVSHDHCERGQVCCYQTANQQANQQVAPISTTENVTTVTGQNRNSGTPENGNTNPGFMNGNPGMGLNPANNQLGPNMAGNQPGFNPSNNNQPVFNPANNNQPGFNPSNNQLGPGIQPGFNPPNNNQPVFNPANNNQPGFNMANNQLGLHPAGNQPGFNPANNNQPVFNPANSNQPGFNMPNNNQPGFNQPNTNPVFNPNTAGFLHPALAYMNQANANNGPGFVPPPNQNNNNNGAPQFMNPSNQGAGFISTNHLAKRDVDVHMQCCCPSV